MTPLSEADALRKIADGRDNGRPRAVAVTFDDKGKLILPDLPAAEDVAGQCAWLTAVFALHARHPITRAMHEGLRGAAGHVVLQRLGAPPLRFEPAGRISNPQRLVEDLAWQREPYDEPVHALKAEHCRLIAHVVRQLCGVTRALTDEQETAAIVGTFLQGAVCAEGHTTHGDGRQRYEAAAALQPGADDVTGRPVGPPRYLVDANTGELVARCVDLAAVARQYVGGSLARGWLDARLANIGWQRVHLDGRALPGRAGRKGPHAHADIYRGHLPATADSDLGTDTETAVTR